MKRLAAVLLLLAGAAYATPQVVTVSSDTHGWQLLKNGSPYFIHGIAYGLEKIPEDPNIATYEDWMVMDSNSNGLNDVYENWIDTNLNNTQDASEPVVGDFQLLKEMGINTIRVYHHPSDDPVIEACYPPATNPGGALIFNHALNKTLLRDLYTNYGIMTAMGDEVGAYAGSSCADYVAGTDYTNSVQIASMTLSVRAMVADSKDEPWLLMYVLGNENNYSFTHTNAYLYPTEYYVFISSMVDLIHSLDPNHPVALANGEDQYITLISTTVPRLDIFGANVYRNEGTLTGMGTFWSEISTVWNKPVMITEYGSVAPQYVGGLFDEDYQVSILLNYACDIENHAYNKTSPRNSIGGFQYAWTDNWWQGGNPYALYVGSPNAETTGIVSQGAGTHSPFERQLKKAYEMYKSLYVKKCIDCGS